jgi:hypothetical protein
VRHGAHFRPAPDAAAAVADLVRDGCAVLRGVLPRETVEALGEQVDDSVRDARLVPARVRKPFTEQVIAADDQQQLRRLALAGEDQLASKESMVYVSDPLVSCPAAVPLLFADIVLDVAAGYYRCPPALISPKIVRSYVNELPETSVNRFHCDYQRVPFLKVFVYLCDVDSVEDGPFCFVAGSHRRKPPGWRKHPLAWSADEITDVYGAAAVRPLTARRGDLILADTRGFHRGIKVRSRPRTMLKVSTGLRPWRGTAARLPAPVAAGMSAKQLAAADFLDIR